ncbi:NACHT domain-containing protein [Micromonospora sp. NPDC049559]|uniref:NACHT domain-containing protein n=1 Tax=Micromonospora sp. NPDC049559 TaxID=3155923 RepID=UPI0034157C84
MSYDPDGRPGERVSLSRGIRLRTWLRTWLRRLRRFRLPAVLLATVLSVSLSTVYDDIPPHLQIVALVVLGVAGAIGALPTEPGGEPAMAGGHLAPTGSSRHTGRSGGATPKRKRRRERRKRKSRAGRVWWRWLPRRRVRAVPTLPPRDVLFVGRAGELVELRERHDRQRAERDAASRRRLGWRRAGGVRAPATGPVMLLVHGAPGVGKSALVDGLARSLADRYPDGQVYVSLGTGSTARSPNEVLQELLLALGWDEKEMRKKRTTADRALVFRSLTARKRILFIFDAARHAEQVRAVMPSDPATAVLITSRRELLWPDPLPYPSYRLGLPDADDALAMFHTISGVEEGLRPECVAEVIEYCGRLPLAIRAAAERVSEDRADVCQVAGLLREKRSRLAWLVRPGRSLRGHLMTEYQRLLPEEQRALMLLALVPSATFVPSVLCPLLELPPGEAEALVDRLAAAQLLDDRGMDPTERVARYGIHPLTRLFAFEQAVRLPEDEVGRAFARLDAAYLDVVTAALKALDEESAPARSLARRIADYPQRWVRNEYPNLLRLIRAPGTADAVRWRIGAWLDGCVVADVPLRASLGAYEEAVRAAEREGERLGQVDVLLAQGTFLVAVERYRDAERSFTLALHLCLRLRDGGPTEEVRATASRRFTKVLRKRGEAYLQAARHRQAIDALEAAYRNAEATGDRPEQRLIRVLLGEAHHVDTPEAAKDELLDPVVPDATRYRILLSLAEAGRRRGDWHSATDYFGAVLSFVEQDQRRRATVQYRMARFLLGQAAAPRDELADPRPGTAPAVLATRRAADAAVLFRQMENPVGEVRAYCMLARTVLQLGRSVEADRLAHVAGGKLGLLHAAGEPREVLAPLAARLDRVRGEIRLRAGDYEGGRHLLMTAAAMFAAQEDWAALRDVLRSLEVNRPAARSPVVSPGPEPLGVDDARAGRVFSAVPAGLSVTMTERLAEPVPTEPATRGNSGTRVPVARTPEADPPGPNGVPGPDAVAGSAGTAGSDAVAGSDGVAG